MIPHALSKLWLPLLLLGAVACSANADESKRVDKAPARAAADAVATVGQLAPDFELTDLDGEPWRLSDHRGKTVILEWFNPGCPYVRHGHEEGGALHGRAAKFAEEGVVWVAINSGKPGKQGHGAEVNRAAAAEWSMGYPLLLDETSAVGRLYDAVTTPHMYIIDGEGILRYAGGIDNAPMGRADGEYRHHVDRAMEDLREGREVRTPRTKPYGCSVKY